MPKTCSKLLKYNTRPVYLRNGTRVLTCICCGGTYNDDGEPLQRDTPAPPPVPTQLEIFPDANLAATMPAVDREYARLRTLQARRAQAESETP